MPPPRSGPKLSDQIPVWMFFTFLALLVAGGGSARPGILMQPVIWLASIAVVASVLWVHPWVMLRKTAMPALGFVAAMALLILVQLVPLPPSLWQMLPGRAVYHEVAVVAGLPPPWRPATLTPDLTWANLVSLLPLCATILGYAAMRAGERRWLLPLIVMVIVGSAILGLAQLTAGPESPLRYYPVTNTQSAVGVFANRNHQAMLLVVGLPVLATWARIESGDARVAQARYWLALASGLFLLPMILATGSRAGLALSVAALIGTAVLVWLPRDRTTAVTTYLKNPLLLRFLPIVAGIMVMAATVFLARAQSVERLFDSSFAEEERALLLAPLWTVTTTFFPIGSGFGSFDPVFRQFEPFALLRTTFLNHAHNDLAQILIEGGLASLVLLIAFLVWWGRQTAMLWQSVTRFSAARVRGRLGSIIIFILLTASLFDYPLRMPILAVVFTIAALWMHEGIDPAADRSGA